MDWDASVLKFNYDDCDEWFETSGRWAGATEHAVQNMTFNILTDITFNFLLRSNLRYTEEPMESNIHLESLCGGAVPLPQTSNIQR